MSERWFYTRGEDGAFVPTASTVGPWDPSLQHGGPPAALLGGIFEATAPRLGSRVAYFSLDFFGPVPLAPMSVAAEVVRPGKKIELLSAVASIGGRPALRASAWRLLTEPGRNAEIGLADPPPPLPDARAAARFPGMAAFGYGEALDWRVVDGGFGQLGPSTVWSRLEVAVVRDEPVSALARALAMVDSANGVSAVLDMKEYLSVPVNLTVSLARAPIGEWVGMRAATALASEGTGTTRARLFDARGSFGESLQTLYVAKR